MSLSNSSKRSLEAHYTVPNKSTGQRARIKKRGIKVGGSCDLGDAQIRTYLCQIVGGAHVCRVQLWVHCLAVQQNEVGGHGGVEQVLVHRGANAVGVVAVLVAHEKQNVVVYRLRERARDRHRAGGARRDRRVLAERRRGGGCARGSVATAAAARGRIGCQGRRLLVWLRGESVPCCARYKGEERSNTAGAMTCQMAQPQI